MQESIPISQPRTCKGRGPPPDTAIRTKISGDLIFPTEDLPAVDGRLDLFGGRSAFVGNFLRLTRSPHVRPVIRSLINKYAACGGWAHPSYACHCPRPPRTPSGRLNRAVLGVLGCGRYGCKTRPHSAAPGLRAEGGRLARTADDGVKGWGCAHKQIRGYGPSRPDRSSSRPTAVRTRREAQSRQK